jgi:hypothetical protein
LLRELPQSPVPTLILCSTNMDYVESTIHLGLPETSDQTMIRESQRWKYEELRKDAHHSVSDCTSTVACPKFFLHLLTHYLSVTTLGHSAPRAILQAQMRTIVADRDSLYKSLSPIRPHLVIAVNVIKD